MGVLKLRFGTGLLSNQASDQRQSATLFVYDSWGMVDSNLDDGLSDDRYQRDYYLALTPG